MLAALAPHSFAATFRSRRLFLRAVLLAGGSLAGIAAAPGGARAAPADEPVIELPTVTIEARRGPAVGQPPDAEGVKDYRVTRSSTAAKGDVDNRDVPQGVSVIPQKILEDQGAQTLNDVFRNAAGVQPTQSATAGAQWPAVRGFTVRNVYKDGMRDDTFDRSYWLGNVERVEILKGPASVLYGDGNPGGVINFISKRPLPETTATAAGWFGSFDASGAMADVSVKATADGRFLFRAIADTSYSDTFIDNNPVNARHFSGRGEALVSDSTTLVLGTEYRTRTTGAESGLPVYGTLLGRDLGLSRSANYNAPWSRRTDTGKNISARVTHEFAPGLSVTSGLLLNDYRFSYDGLTTITGYNAARTALNRRAIIADSTTREVISDTSVTGVVATGPFSHRLTGGVELSYGTVERLQYFGTIAAVSILNPGASAGAAAGNYTLNSNLDFKSYRQAVYAQDLIDLTHGVKALLGVRYDSVRRTSDERGASKAAYSASDTAATGRFGLTWEAVPGVTLYGGYAQSFAPPGSTVSLGVSGGRLLDPETGDQIEGGVKLDIGGTFTATAAAYQLTRRNVPTADPSNPTYNIAAGEQRSRGFELDATWKATREWSVLAAYAYTDAVITKDNTLPVGNRLDNVPRHSGRLWTVYEIGEGPLAGLSFGGGVTMAGSRPGDLYDTYTLPAYATVDLAASYTWKGAKLSLTGTNILDRDYYLASNASTSAPMVYVGEPAAVMLRAQVTY